MSGPRSLVERTDANRLASRRLPLTRAIVMAGLVGAGVVLLVSPWWVGLVVAVVLAGLIGGLLPRRVLRGLPAVLGSRPAPASDFPRYHNLVEGLSITSGVAPPELHVIDDRSPNLLVIGPPGEAVMVATTSLLEILDRVELEAVLAEGLARIRSHDAHVGAQAALWVCGPLLRRGPLRGGAGPLLAMSADRRSRRLRRLLGPQRELLADLAAVDLTRYPPGLLGALEKLAERGTAVESATWGTAHLWLADPLADAPDGDRAAQRLNAGFRTHEPIEHRAALVAEL